MASKLIAIKEELYERLSKLKKRNESFSDIIEHLLKNVEKNPLAHFGIAQDLDDKDLDDFESYLFDNRKKSRTNQKIIEI
ncbi:antitoxin VapB family protein [Candidatus Harpocratesius sp.]